jgi:hypothetical protein
MKTNWKTSVVAIVAVISGTAMAFATQSGIRPSKVAETYFVSSETDTHYQTTPTSQDCEPEGDRACTILSEVTPDLSGQIAKGPGVSVTAWKD